MLKNLADKQLINIDYVDFSFLLKNKQRGFYGANEIRK